MSSLFVIIVYTLVFFCIFFTIVVVLSLLGIGNGFLMFCFRLLNYIRHIFNFWCRVSCNFIIRLDDFFRTACPWAFAEYGFHIFSVYHLTCDKKLRQLVMALFVFCQNLFCTLILLIDHFQNFVINYFCGSFRVWTLEL